MDRRRFVNAALRASAAAAAWAARTGAFGARPPVLPQPSLPLPGTDAQDRRLIIPTDNPDRFRLKVLELNSIADPIRPSGSWIWEDYDCSLAKAQAWELRARDR
jgi:hypothetical protein